MDFCHTMASKKASKKWEKKCPVESCNYKSNKAFYAIPEHPVRRQAWIEACKLVPPYNKPICFQHFKISDFINEINEEDIAQYKYGNLKKNVVPSQHLPGDPEVSIKQVQVIVEGVKEQEVSTEIVGSVTRCEQIGEDLEIRGDPSLVSVDKQIDSKSEQVSLNFFYSTYIYILVFDTKITLILVCN